MMNIAIYIILAINSIAIIYLLAKKTIKADNIIVGKILQINGYLWERPLDENYKCIDALPEGVNSMLSIGNPSMTRDRTWVVGMGDDETRGWLGGDGDGSFEMPDGKWCWTFGDSFLGTITTKRLFYAHREPSTIHTPRNSFGIMEFGDWDGNPAPSKKTSYVGADKQNQKTLLRFPGEASCN